MKLATPHPSEATLTALEGRERSVQTGTCGIVALEALRKTQLLAQTVVHMVLDRESLS